MVEVHLNDKTGAPITTTNRLPVDVGEIAVTITGGTFTSDLDKIAGTAVDVNSGNKSNGCQRMTIATDDINLAAIKTSTDKIPAQGQALAAASIPVVLPETQITTLTPPAAITNFAKETGGNLATIKTNTDKIPAQGQALAAASMPVVLPAAQETALKSVTLTDNPVTTAKQLRVTTTPYGYDVAEGNIANHSTLFKTGYQATVNDTEVDLWPVLGSYVFPTGAMRMEVVSSSANDSSGGTGVRTVKIWYLTTGFVEKSETIEMAGLTPVATVATDIYRINAFRVSTAGTVGKAVGNIDVRHLDDTPIYSRILAGNTRARNSIYTVPVSKTLYITQITYSVGHASGGRYARFTLRATYDDKEVTTSTLFYPYHELGIQDGAININMDFPIKFPAGTDVKISVISDANSANAICTGAYRGWLES